MTQWLPTSEQRERHDDKILILGFVKTHLLALSLLSSVTLGKLPNFPVPQFPHFVK